MKNKLNILIVFLTVLVIILGVQLQIKKQERQDLQVKINELQIK